MKLQQVRQITESLTASHQKSGGLLQPLLPPRLPPGAISIDSIVGLPVTQEGLDPILKIVCRLTTMARLIPTMRTAPAEDTARVIVREVRFHGVPKAVVSDEESACHGGFTEGLV